MYRKSAKGWLKHWDFILIDLITLQLAFFLAYMVRYGTGQSPYAVPIYREMAIFLFLDDIAVIFLFDTLRNVLKRNRAREISVTAEQALLVFLVAALYLFTSKEGDSYSRSTLYLFGGFYFGLNSINRIEWKRALSIRRSGVGGRSLLILADKKTAKEVVRNLSRNNYEHFCLAGLVLTDDDGSCKSISGIPVVAAIEEMPGYVCREWIDEVMVFPSAEHPFPSDLLERLAETGVTLHMRLDMEGSLKGKKQMVENVGGYTVLTSSLNSASPKELLAKRLLDILGGLVGSVFTILLLFFVGPAIKLQSPGPVFFSQVRVGRNGKKFRMYKFRSMYMDAEERKQEMMSQNRIADGMMFKMDFDPRVIGNRTLPDGSHKTGLGQFLRNTSLDEFPQFFNVLKGDMSLVGTRPPTTDEWEKYDLHHRARLAVKPGITGVWQASGRSSITDFEEVVKMDTWYIENWSIWLDIRLLIQTVWVVITRKGSM